MRERNEVVFTPRQSSFHMVNCVLGGSLVNMIVRYDNDAL